MFPKKVKPYYDLTTIPFKYLVNMLQKRYNTPESRLFMMNEWASFNFLAIISAIQNLILEESTDFMIRRLEIIKIYLSNGITEFTHKRKLIEDTRMMPEFDITRVHGDLPLSELQQQLKLGASWFTGGSQFSSMASKG